MRNLLEPPLAEAVARQEEMSRMAHQLQETRQRLLRQYGAADEAALLEKILAGGIPEHPAYEHYLSARILEQDRAHISDRMKNLLKASRN